MSQQINESYTTKMNSINESIRCPVCCSPMHSGIINCRNGHSICISCYKQIQCQSNKCPMCKEQYFCCKISMNRNYCMESIIDKLPLPCKNTDYGCKEILSGKQRYVHYQLCEYTPIPCISDVAIRPSFKKCQYAGDLNEVINHAIKYHGFETFKTVNNEFAFQVSTFFILFFILVYLVYKYIYII